MPWIFKKKSEQQLIEWRSKNVIISRKLENKSDEITIGEEKK